MRLYENGKSCPKCFRKEYDNCESNGDVLCVGDIVQKSLLLQKVVSADRFATLREVLPLRYTFTFKDLQCSEANGALSSLRRLAFTLEKKDLGPQVAFFFPCILGIF
ncbi:hypothetical protein E2320_000669, partial [Naja naja]